MLHGPLLGKILLFTLPIALSSMLQQLFNAADTSIVGYFGNSDVLEAVGTNGTIIALIVTLSSGLSIGAKVLTASRIGKKKWAIRFFFCMILAQPFSGPGGIAVIPLWR